MSDCTKILFTAEFPFAVKVHDIVWFAHNVTGCDTFPKEDRVKFLKEFVPVNVVCANIVTS